MQVWSLGWEDPLEKSMATHSSNLAWRIPWTGDPGMLQSTGTQRVRHNWSDLARMHAGSKPKYPNANRKLSLDVSLAPYLQHLPFILLHSGPTALPISLWLVILSTQLPTLAIQWQNTSLSVFQSALKSHFLWIRFQEPSFNLDGLTLRCHPCIFLL